MRRLIVLMFGICSLTAAGCCCWGHQRQSDPCGPGGCGVQQYGQPYQSGALYGPIPTQQVYAPTAITAVPLEALPTYYHR